ncbi:substrate-binding domain-containing protein, partial [Thiolapillus sp.]
MLTRVVALWLLLSATVTMADEIFVAVAVAVASNFAGTLKTITKRFEAATGHKVHISVGATGKQ